MKQKTISVLQLYPRDMNIYGDWGNVLTIVRRLEWHGYTPELLTYNQGDAFPEHVDLVLGGGGQDAGQSKIQDDLLKIGPKLHELAEADVPMLVICGLYQLFGKFFKTSTGEIIKGIELLDLETYAGSERLIGNIVTQSDDFGDIVGYENHSGQTFLADGVKAFGTVVRGAGNSGKDATEGARYKNVIGSYLHGSLLPKNPQVADWLITQAVRRKYGDFEPNVINDTFALKARGIAASRPR
ncbi:MAG TPA: glutamine amidotransferase [Candidatus Saccharibacteria bacterium]|nr:glutamine amidotransferase [Candidatus Saccharibacteria bacterium]